MKRLLNFMLSSPSQPGRNWTAKSRTAPSYCVHHDALPEELLANLRYVSRRGYILRFRTGCETLLDFDTRTGLVRLQPLALRAVEGPHGAGPRAGPDDIPPER